jgi:hypothetical protein
MGQVLKAVRCRRDWTEGQSGARAGYDILMTHCIAASRRAPQKPDFPAAHMTEQYISRLNIVMANRHSGCNIHQLKKSVTGNKSCASFHHAGCVRVASLGAD